jgi:hypothetical protein
MIKNGLSVERVSWETYETQISQESTFMACPHPGQPEQLELMMEK